MWKPDGSDTYARSYGGRVARLPFAFATAAWMPIIRRSWTRGRELLGSGTGVARDKLSESTATSLAKELAERWKRDKILRGEADIPSRLLLPSDGQEPEDHFTDEEEGPQQGPPAKKVKRKEREAKCVIVSSPGSIRRLHRAGKDGCWMG